MTAIQLVGPIAEQQQQPLRPQAAGQKGHERARRAVGPVHVLEHQHHGRLFSGKVKQLEHRLKQPHLTGRVLPDRGWFAGLQAGQQRGQLVAGANRERIQRRVPATDERAQRAQQRRVGQLPVGRLHALPVEDQRVGIVTAQPGLKLGDQSRLADPGVTAEQDERRSAAGCLPGGEPELRQLADASHKPAAGQS